MICTQCRSERQTKLTATGQERLPAGWKRTDAGTFCAMCWGKQYILRAVTIPIASPLGDGSREDLWKQLRSELKPMFALTTEASNWMMTELYTRDVRRNGQEKIPPMAPVYLYPEARALFPGLPSQSVAALEQSAKKRYRRLRYKLIWQHSISLPTFRYPVPFPQPNQAWHAAIESDALIVSLRIGENRWRLRLKCGPQFHRQFTQFRLIASGEAQKGECVVYERGTALMVKMVAWLPRQAVSQCSRVLAVRTAKDALLVAVNGKDERIWTYHAAHIPRWVAEHARELQAWADDSKFENRPIPNFSDRRKAATVKYRDRMRSAVQQTAAYVAGYAQRRKFACVDYDDSERGFCPGFLWAALREALRLKLDEYGIEFRPVASDEAGTGAQEPLAKEES